MIQNPNDSNFDREVPVLVKTKKRILAGIVKKRERERERERGIGSLCLEAK